MLIYNSLAVRGM